jgi:hypothetical protein
LTSWLRFPLDHPDVYDADPLLRDRLTVDDTLFGVSPRRASRHPGDTLVLGRELHADEPLAAFCYVILADT